MSDSDKEDRERDLRIRNEELQDNLDFALQREWRVPPDVHSIEIDHLMSRPADPFEGPGETWEQGYLRVSNAFDLLRLQNQKYLELIVKQVYVFEKLAKLGNGDCYGNSVGNEIAITALKDPLLLSIVKPSVYESDEIGDIYFPKVEGIYQPEDGTPEAEALDGLIHGLTGNHN